MKYWLGIDPGKKGSLAVIDNNNRLCCIHQMPTVKLKKEEIDIPYLLSKLKDYKQNYGDDLFACLEKSSAMPGQGVTSMFSYGMTYGIIIGCLHAAKIPFMEVHPATWTKLMYKGISGEGKQRSLVVARQLYPQFIPKYKYEQDWADSILIATYAKRNLVGGTP